MMGSKRLAAFAAAMVALVAAGAPARADVRPIEQTLSYEMLQAEGGVRPITRAKFALLRSVLDRATAAALAEDSRPRTRREAIEVLDAVQEVLAEHNFLQPIEPEDWRETLGDALEPLQLSREERLRLLAPGELNGFRARYIDPNKPLYFVDDDIGAQLFVSVGQRLGWDIRMVMVSDRYFVRWHVTPSVLLNWDWTAGGPRRDEDYVAGEGVLYRTWRERRRDFSSLSLRYSRAHFLYLIARNVQAPASKQQLLDKAMRFDATHEGVQNSLAWLYATDPAFRRSYGRRALQYALSAWAATPRDPSVADTVACSFAAYGDRSMGVQVQRFAIDRLREMRLSTIDYERRLQEIQAGGACSP
jgi:hypothetical protein